MMLKMIFSVLLALFDKLPALEIPELFEQFDFVFQTISSLLVVGIDFCIMFMGATAVRFIGIYLGIIILLDAFYLAYQSVWWFLTKIPMLNVRP